MIYSVLPVFEFIINSVSRYYEKVFFKSLCYVNSILSAALEEAKVTASSTNWIAPHNLYEYLMNP